MNIGKVVQVIGPVLDVEFPSGKLPAIYNAIKIKLPHAGNGAAKGESSAQTLTVEVASHLGDNMVRAIAKQAEAERDRRAKIIHAEAEFQASQTLVNAAQILSSIPAAMQLRYLQTLTEIGAEQNSTVVFPMPIDIIKPFLALIEKAGKPVGANGDARVPLVKDIPLEGHERGNGQGGTLRIAKARQLQRAYHRSRSTRLRRSKDRR